MARGYSTQDSYSQQQHHAPTYQQHLNFHSKEITYPCKECSRVFASYMSVEGRDHFRGFFLQARDADTNEWIGTFKESPNTKVIPECAAITHADPKDKEAATFVWNAPQNQKGRVYFTDFTRTVHRVGQKDFLKSLDGTSTLYLPNSNENHIKLLGIPMTKANTYGTRRNFTDYVFKDSSSVYMANTGILHTHSPLLIYIHKPVFALIELIKTNKLPKLDDLPPKIIPVQLEEL